MEIHIDERQFDALQMEAAYAIAHEIYTALKAAGAPDTPGLQEIVAKALFGIGAILDGGRALEGADGPMQVMLTFRAEGDDKPLWRPRAVPGSTNTRSVSPRTISIGCGPSANGDNWLRRENSA